MQEGRRGIGGLLCAAALIHQRVGLRRDYVVNPVRIMGGLRAESLTAHGLVHGGNGFRAFSFPAFFRQKSCTQETCSSVRNAAKLQFGFQLFPGNAQYPTRLFPVALVAFHDHEKQGFLQRGG
jgi:hypothetical protein